MQETGELWVPSLGWEDPMEEELPTQSSILAWRIPWTKELDGLQSMGSQELESMGSQESDTTECTCLPHLHTHTHTHAKHCLNYTVQYFL